jgi:N-acetylglucosaminyl-diphospho-decaprenol L-rhamnosyltransferase
VSFTAVVVLHGSRADLERLLASLRAMLPEPPQLVVVDTGPDDGGAALASEHGAEVVPLPGNPGFGAANNAGVARARHDVTVLLNPDVELVDDGLERLVARARAREGLHVPRLLNADGSVQRSAHPVPGRATALLPALVHPRALPRRARLDADPWRADAPREVGWAIAACLAARTPTLRGLGPFDPGQFLFYEDLDLCLRARAVGVPTVLHPDVALRHAGAHSTGPAFGGEPVELLARRRREVVGTRLGRRALLLDDAAQSLTFASRWAARSALRRDASREARQFRAVRAARRSAR